MKRSFPRLMAVAAASTAIGLTWSAIPATAGTGPAWQIATAIGLKQASNLFSVVASGPHSAWIFGLGVKGKPLTLHWDGSAWQRGTIPGARVAPRHVSATSAGNVWASAADCFGGPGSPPGSPYVARWNGGRWSSTVFHGNDWCAGFVVTAGYRNGWLFGNGPHAMHLQGTTWHQVSLGHVGSVVTATALSASNAWAFSYSDRTHRTFALHWNGNRWNQVALPAVKFKNGLHLYPWTSYSSAQTGLWLSETTLPGPPYLNSVLLHRTARGWQRVAVPGGAVIAMTADGTGGLWGLDWKRSNYQFLHYTNGVWVTDPLPIAGLPGNPTRVESSGFDLAAIPGTQSVWATGEADYDNSAGNLQRYSLIYRYGP